MNVNELFPFCCRDPSNPSPIALPLIRSCIDMGHPHATMAVGSCHHGTPKTANDKIEKCQNCSSEAYYHVLVEDLFGFCLLLAKRRCISAFYGISHIMRQAALG
jgi:hypothetical protein